MIMNVGKKIICIKDIPSNIIDEAIFILKSNVVDCKKGEIEEKSKAIILNEAEEIVDEYINKIHEEKNAIIEENNDKIKRLKKEMIYIIGLLIILGICIYAVI